MSEPEATVAELRREVAALRAWAEEAKRAFGDAYGAYEVCAEWLSELHFEFPDDWDEPAQGLRPLPVPPLFEVVPWAPPTRDPDPESDEETPVEASPAKKARTDPDEADE
jgi:hypothetical protein